MSFRKKANIKVGDIPIDFKFGKKQFFIPIDDEALNPLFEIARHNFQKDFEDKHFLDPSLQLVYSTQPGGVR